MEENQTNKLPMVSETQQNEEYVTDKAGPLSPHIWLFSRADRLLKNAEIFEKHQRLGHLRRVDGNQIAADLRALAEKIRHEES
jgi:hypothetical protein